MQLVPAVRRAAPSVHRWIGRVYIASAFGIAFGSMYLMWCAARWAISQHLGSTFNAILLAVFAVIALRQCARPEFGAAPAVALRLFMVMNGVWFFRFGFAVADDSPAAGWL